MHDLRDDPRQKIVGMRQVLRYASKGLLTDVFLASDADDYVRGKIKEACAQAEIPVHDAQDMLTLGDICGIKVGAAVVGLLEES